MSVKILITGCSSGIGKQTALYLKQKGYSVIATARKEDDVKKLKNLGLDSYLLDVVDESGVNKTFEAILQKYKTLDVVFNNAGYGQPGAIEDIRVEVLKEQFEVNVFGVHRVTLKALEIFKKQGYGKLIQHSSVLGLVSLRFRGAYNASKYAIGGLSDTLRLELMGSNIYVSLLNTGPITSHFRINAKAKLKQNIDINSSRFKELYLLSLKKEKSDVPFNLPAIQVAKVVEQIIKAKDPLETGELEFFAYHINEALLSISNITRPYEHSAMLDVMFGEFCLGK